MKNKVKRRKNRVRQKLRAKNHGKLRLSVFRSNSNIFAQIIDDQESKTLVSASSLEEDVKSKHKNSNLETARKVGELIGERAIANKITEVYFDRGCYLFHGKVAALADAAREKGLKF